MVRTPRRRRRRGGPTVVLPAGTPSPRRDSLNELLLHIPARRTTESVEYSFAARDDKHGHQSEDSDVQVAAALEVSRPVWKSTSESSAPDNSSLSQ